MKTKRGLPTREMISLSRRYGLKTALYASATLLAGGFLPNLGAFALRAARAESKAKYKFRFGTVINRKNDRFIVSAVYRFTELIEEKSDGEITIQIIDKGQACAERTCAQKVANGVLHIGSSSATNLSTVAAYSNAIDWTMMWRNRDEIYNFLFSPESEKLYRGVLRSVYGLEMMHYYGDMRSVFMGLKYVDRPEIRTPDALKGAKLRISNSEMYQKFATSLAMSPIPLAWVETLEGMKSGVVDAMETFPSAAAGFGMTKVSAQAINIDFSPGVNPAYFSARSFDKLPDRLKEVVYEAAWEAQKIAYVEGAVANDTMVGSGPNPSPESNYQKLPMRHVRLTEEERNQFRQVVSVETNMHLYGDQRKKLDKIAGFDVFGAMKSYAASVRGKSVDMQKWWV